MAGLSLIKLLGIVEALKHIFIYKILPLPFDFPEFFVSLDHGLINPLTEQYQNKGTANEQFRYGLIERLILDGILFLLGIEILPPEILIRLLPQFLLFRPKLILLLLTGITDIVLFSILRRKFLLFNLLQIIVGSCQLYKMLLSLLSCGLFQSIGMVLFGKLSITLLDLLLGCGKGQVQKFEVL
jgi:hypothetical protein